MIKKRHVQLPGTAGAHDMQPGQRRPEALVGFGIRYRLAGFRSGDVGCWELAWNVYATELGPFCWWQSKLLVSGSVLMGSTATAQHSSGRAR